MSQQPLAPSDYQAPKGLENEDRTGADTAPNEPSGGMAAGESHPRDPNDGADAASEQPPPPGEEYPPQLHAGQVGYGPEFGKGAGFSDKVEGIKEQLKGKVKHDPDLVEHGHEKMTGELKKKELEGDDGNPFGKAEEGGKKEGDK